MKENNVVCIAGDFDCGQTELMTCLIADEYFDNDKFIVSNYYLDFPSKNAPLEEIISQPEWLNNCIVAIDDITRIAPACLYISDVNKQTAEFFTVIRKLNLQLFYTTDWYLDADKRIRDQTDILILCKKRYDYNFEICRDVINLEIYNIDAGGKERLMNETDYDISGARGLFGDIINWRCE
ncbi:MAG: hypothetical protein ACLFVB_10290 [Thermoplasmata archaeon]